MATEKRLIDANALVANFRKTKMDEVFPNWKELSPTTTAAIIRLTTKYRAIILNAPTVDAVEVVHGVWDVIEDDYLSLVEMKCSVCGESYGFEFFEDVTPRNYHYCPNCGAKMDGDSNA